ncbi:MAG: FAD-dependent oxidoreductase, partial [Candidatus Atribacteria bacterium]|nr:FAD-dependent oxidoreductase [Candidatus Atribacteria bacterium]
FPDMKIDLYYMDLQILGGKKEKLLSIAREKVRLVRHLPYRVEPGPEGKGLTLLFEDEQGVNRADYDAVVLSVGMVPSPGTRRVAELFRLSTDESGFIKDYSEGQTSQSGVFVCGTASGPRDIETAILHAKKVATRIMMKTQCQRPRCGKEA